MICINPIFILVSHRFSVSRNLISEISKNNLTFEIVILEKCYFKLCVILEFSRYFSKSSRFKRLIGSNKKKSAKHKETLNRDRVRSSRITRLLFKSLRRSHGAQNYSTEKVNEAQKINGGSKLNIVFI